MFRLEPHLFIDRATGEKREERVYGEWALALVYGPLRFLVPLISGLSFLSKFYGWLQRRPRSRRKIAPFIEAFDIDTSEFTKQEFESFDDFFVRTLRPSARPLADIEAVIPADGRYWVCPDVTRCQDFYVKGQRLSVEELVGENRGGALVLGRLCPTDCHQFLFPCSGVPSEAQLINGPLASVNPVALRRNLRILTQNKRFVTRLDSPDFGEVLIVEIGAAHVGAVHQTYIAGKAVEKGTEKGFFSFGGSAIALLFERISLSEDILEGSSHFLETRCLMGQPLGKKI